MAKKPKAPSIKVSPSLKKKFDLLQKLKSEGIDRDARKCIYKIQRTGQYCDRWAIAGGTVCPKHGGSAPQVKRAAMEFLLGQVAPTMNRLVQIRDQDVHLPSALGASNTLLNRALGKVGDTKANEGQKGPTIQIGISLTGAAAPQVSTVAVGTKLLESGSNAVDAEYFDDDDEEDDE